MSIFAGRIGLALVLAALCLGGRTAHAQAVPVPYWIPSWPAGFGGNLTVGQSPNTYGNFPSFDGSDARGGGFLGGIRFLLVQLVFGDLLTHRQRRDGEFAFAISHVVKASLAVVEEGPDEP